MAYGLKYQSNFYNFHGKLVSVLINKRDYVSTVTQVRTESVEIENNFQNIETGVVGTGAKVVIRVDSTEMLAYDDLLRSLEKEFQCIISHDGSIVFIGYSICDLNERQILPYAAITLQFTDYLRRLSSKYLEAVAFPNTAITLASIIKEALLTCEVSNSLLINSSLFEENMNQGAYDEFYSQVHLDSYIFHSSPSEYDNAYDTLNKALHSFGAYIYQYSGMWCIERQEDILRTDDWLRELDISTGGDTFAPNSNENLRQVLNRQDGDFKYRDMSQIVSYESGLKTLILRLQDKQLESFVFNDYAIDNMEEVSDFFPDPGTLDYRIWYRHTNVSIVGNGYAYRDMASYIKWTYEQALTFNDTELAGLYYAFQIQFPISPEEPVVLNIDYKTSAGDIAVPVGANARIRFCIRIDGGPRDGQYLTWINNILCFRTEPVPPVGNEVVIPIEATTKPVFSVNVSFNLTDDQQIRVTPASQILTNVWEQLGFPETQKFMIFFFPMEWWLHVPNGFGGYYDTWMLPTPQYIGDINVGLSNQKVLNKLTYYINANFERTEELDMDFFDLDNINFVNGPLVIEGSTSELGKTRRWTSLLNTTAVPLMDVFAKNRFQNYARTIHRLKGKIIYDGYLKPFAVLTDDDLTILDPTAADYGQNIQFILQKYTWDLFNGVYTIDAQEYTNEDLGFNYSQDSGQGSGADSDGTYGVLSAPNIISVNQASPGQGFDVSWTPVTGATSYTLQRQPYYDVYGLWIDSWKTVYIGSNTNTYDAIQNESTPPNALHVMYRVMATNNVLNSAYSGIYTEFWFSI